MLRISLTLNIMMWLKFQCFFLSLTSSLLFTGSQYRKQNRLWQYQAHRGQYGSNGCDGQVKTKKMTEIVT